ncbi:MAG: ComEC/Rec2 family competence protein, partial [Desulfitobacteriaceae bacterium]
TAGLFVVLLLTISGCNSQTVFTNNPTKVEQAKQVQPLVQKKVAPNKPTIQPNSQIANITSAKDTAPTTVLPGQKLKVSYIDVSQGDSILIQIPNGKNILIDAGKPEDANTITSYIKKLGIKRLDIVIGSHPHKDHIGSMATIIKTFDIGQVIMPRKASSSQTYIDLMTAIQTKGLKITEAEAGLTLELGPEVNALFLAPTPQKSENSNNENVNNYSAVLKLTYGTNSFLFMADAQDKSENEMLSAGYNLKVDVLKVGQSGSATSNSVPFLAKANPKCAIISVGEHNDYGLPDQITLNNLSKLGSKVFRTDQYGTIVVESDGTIISVYNISSNVITSNDPPNAPVKTPSAIPATRTSTSSPVLPPIPVNPSKQETTLYRAATGNIYHIDGCKLLPKSKTPISLAEVKTKGYTPCKACNPPQ